MYFKEKGEDVKEQVKTIKKFGEEAIFDARSLGGWRFFVLGFQHLFAMFGATVLVPLLTGLPISSTLLFAGLGTLLFHLISKKKVPAFLGSSFAFLAGYMSIAPNKEPELLLYACFGVALAGLMYLILAFAFQAFGAKKVMQFFPPVVTGPIIIAIGLNLSKSAVENCSSNWALALTAIVVVIVCNIFGRGMVKIIPILLGVLVSYLLAAVLGFINFEPVKMRLGSVSRYSTTERYFLSLQAEIWILPYCLAVALRLFLSPLQP